MINLAIFARKGPYVHNSPTPSMQKLLPAATL